MQGPTPRVCLVLCQTTMHIFNFIEEPLNLQDCRSYVVQPIDICYLTSQWLLRAGLVGASVFNTFWISGAYWATTGMNDLLCLEHSLCADALCPVALDLHHLKQVRLKSGVSVHINIRFQQRSGSLSRLRCRLTYLALGCYSSHLYQLTHAHLQDGVATLKDSTPSPMSASWAGKWHGTAVQVCVKHTIFS